MTTSRPFLTRFALPIVDRVRDEPDPIVRLEDQVGQAKTLRGESRFTRVKNETTDDE
jgi:hypothetical protein